MVIKFICLFLLSFVVVSPSHAFNNNFSVFEALYLGGKNNNILSVSQDRQEAAQKFISAMGDEAVGFLSSKKLSQAQKTKSFRKLLNKNFDMNTISRFSLGRHWRVATSAQKKEYQSLVRNMVVDVYSQRFNEYQGESFEVKSSRPTGKRDYLVSSLIVPSGGSKVKVDWRVRDNNGTLKIIDVIIEGVSMTLTQRAEFSSVIQRGGGNIEALLEHLRNK